MFGFEKLEIWNKAIEFADEIYLVKSSFPSDERFGLTNQLRRAAVSIAANVAEGSGRASNQEFSRFISIAYGSLVETASHLHIASRRQFVGDNQFENLRARAEELARMLRGLKASLQE